MPDDMVERVAKAMAENAGFCWENCAQPQWESDARAAIEAMREPTERMLYAATIIAPTWDDEVSRRKWRAMIEGAL